MPEKLVISPDFFYIDGEKTPLLCGEMHYFRMERASWAPALERLGEAGCNAVALYVPWFVHEYEPDRFDFDGVTHPSNDLVSFLRMVADSGLIALVRPGPYVYAETADLGIPRWFTERYPNAHPQEYAEGGYRNYGMPRHAPHNHPDFLARAAIWLDAVMRIIRPFLTPEGPVCMLQLCNEIPADDHRDENPETLGLGDPDGLWPGYLREIYGSAEALGAAYGVTVERLEDCPPHKLCLADATRYEREKLRYYYEWYYPAYFARLRAMLGPLPPGLLLFHNAYNPKALSLHGANQTKNPWLTIGVDCYYSMTGPLTLQAATYFNDFGAAYSRALIKGNPPWIAEQECGYWHDFPLVYGGELYIWNVWSFAAGYRGANLYLFCAGENRPGLGFFGTSHDWQAPVTKEGLPARTYEHIARALRDIRRDFDLFSAPMAHDVVLALPGTPGLIWTPVSNVARDAYFLLRSIGFQPRVVNLDEDALPADLPVWVVTDDAMPAENQQKLCRFLAAGGRLIVQGALPIKDEEGRLCSLLADALMLRAEAFRWEVSDQNKFVYEGREIYIGEAIQSIQGPDDAAWAREAATGRPAIWRVSAGGGQALVIPFRLEMRFWDVARATEALLGRFGVTALVSGAQFLRVFVKEDGRAVALNLHPERVEETITIQGRALSVALDAYSYREL